MDDCTYLIYTHSDFDDILEITLKRIQKFFASVVVSICTNNASLIDEKYKDIYNIQHVYEYDDSLTYSQKVASVLERISTTYVLFNHDHNILFNDVNVCILRSIMDEMTKNGIDTVRLSTDGVDDPIMDDSSLLKKNTGPYYFSVSSAIWRTHSIFSLFTKYESSTYRNIEYACQEYAAQLKNYYISSSHDSPHCCSCYYPFVHTTRYSKWLLHNNKDKIIDMAKEYSIDLYIRGVTYNL